MPLPDYRIYDADNHYYEPDDCFTRHIESQWKARTVRIERGGAAPGRMFVGDERCHFFSVGAGDSVGPPGAMKEFLRGASEEGGSPSLHPIERARGAGVRRAGRAARGDGRAGRRGVPDAADDRRRRRTATARTGPPRRALPEPARVQPLARRGLGLRRRRPHLRGADLFARRRRRSHHRTRSPARARRALRGAHHRPHRRPLARRSALRSVLGALPGSAASTSSTTSAARRFRRSTTCRGDCGRIRRRTGTR